MDVKKRGGSTICRQSCWVADTSIIPAASKKGMCPIMLTASSIERWRMAGGLTQTPRWPASKTLPLGTTAKVTNLENGRSATVMIEDRGPWGRGRVVDVTPKVAEQLDIRKDGVASVIVAPIVVPQPHGGVKLGAGAADASSQEIEKATQDTASIAR